MKDKKLPSMAGAGIAVDEKWRAEDDLRTLARAEEIKSDKKRYAAAKEMARAQMAACAKAC